MKLASLSRVAMGAQSAIETQVMSSWTILSSVHSALTAPIANMLPSKYVSTIKAVTNGKVLFWLSNRMGCSSKLELYSPMDTNMGPSAKNLKKGMTTEIVAYRLGDNTN